MKQKIADKRILFPPTPQGRPREKVFLRELATKFPGLPSVVLSPFTSDGTQQIRELFGRGVFAFPKPSGLIHNLLRQVADEDDIVLDSFAGSGTTGQAVLELNNEDGGNRTFVLIQSAYDTKENQQQKVNICQSVTAERIRRVIQGYEFSGTKDEVLLEQKVTLATLKKADELLTRIEATKKNNASAFSELQTQCQDGVVRVIGKREIKGRTKGVGGSFTYSRLGPPLFGEYRDFAGRLPSYEELAKYIFYTETSRDFDRDAINEKTGKIGEYKRTSYYVLYTPDGKKDRALDLAWLASLDKTEKNRHIVVYCEKIWVHRDDLAKYETEMNRTVRPMLVPFGLK